MIYLTVDNGIILNDAYNKPRSLIDFSPAANQSDMAQWKLFNEVQRNLQILFNDTP